MEFAAEEHNSKIVISVGRFKNLQQSAGFVDPHNEYSTTYLDIW